MKFLQLLKVNFLYIVFGLLFINVLYNSYNFYNQEFTNVNISNFLTFYVLIIQNSIFFFGFILLFFKNLPIKYILLVIPIASFEVSNSIFLNTIHPFLFSIGFYNLFNNPSNISPEYTRIGFLVLVLFLFLIKTIKFKSFYNIFLSLSMLGILLTAILFHTITIKELDYYSAHQNQTWKKLVQDSNPFKVKDKCDLLQIECQLFSITENPMEKTTEYIVPEIRDWHLQNWDKQERIYSYFINIDLTTNNRLHSRKPMAIIKNNTYNLIIIDRKNYTEYLEFSQFIFSILAIISHLVWFLGAIYLIYFHNKKIKQKYKTQTQN